MDNLNNMNITYRIDKNIGHIFLEGDLDLLTKRIVETRIKEVVDNCSHLEIHLDSVDYMDSSGLSTLFGAARLLFKNNKTFSVTGANERVQNLFKMTNFDAFLKLHGVDTR